MLDIIPDIIREVILGIALLATRARIPPINAPIDPARRYLTPLELVVWSILHFLGISEADLLQRESTTETR